MTLTAGQPLPDYIERRVGVMDAALYKNLDGMPSTQMLVGRLIERVVLAEQLLENLTPGGSEFYRNPERCAIFAEGMIMSAVKVAVERNRLRSIVAEMEMQRA